MLNRRFRNGLAGGALGLAALVAGASAVRAQSPQADVDAIEALFASPAASSLVATAGALPTQVTLLPSHNGLSGQARAASGSSLGFVASTLSQLRRDLGPRRESLLLARTSLSSVGQDVTLQFFDPANPQGLSSALGSAAAQFYTVSGVEDLLGALSAPVDVLDEETRVRIGFLLVTEAGSFDTRAGVTLAAVNGDASRSYLIHTIVREGTTRRGATAVQLRLDPPDFVAGTMAVSSTCYSSSGCQNPGVVEYTRLVGQGGQVSVAR